MSNLTETKDSEWLVSSPSLRPLNYYKILNELSNENIKLKKLLKRVVNVTDFYHKIKIASVIDYRVWYNIAKEINQVLGEE